MEKSLQAPNDNNLSRNGEQPPLVVTKGGKTSGTLEAYYIVEGANTERFYIRHLEKLNKLKYRIKEYEDVECPEGKLWKIIDGIKCLQGGDYFSKLNSLEELCDKSDNNNDALCSFGDLIDAIDKTIDMPRRYIICIFDLDKCMEEKEESENFFQIYKSKLLLLSKNEYNIFCVSMPNVEYWFLSHFDDCAVFDDKLSYNTDENKENVINGLNVYLNGTFYSKRGGFCKSRRCKSLFSFLCNDENLKRAIGRAKAKSNHPHRLDRVEDRMDCDVSYSDMYKLFEIK